MLRHFEGVRFGKPLKKGLVASFEMFRSFFFTFRFEKSEWKPMDFCFVLLYMRNFEKK